MTDPLPTPLIRLAGMFPDGLAYGKCEFLATSGCFKIRGANHLLKHLREAGGTRHLVVPSMGNTALGAATAARDLGFTMTGVVPQNIAAAKEERLRALGAELIKIETGGTELLRIASKVARERAGYFVHPHLDPLWTDGYESIAAEVLAALPECRTIVFPLGGGGLLLGLLKYAASHTDKVRLVGVEPHSYPKYARFDHTRTGTIADGLRIETPHPDVQAAIAKADIEVFMVSEGEIRAALKEIYETQGLVIEPSSAVALAALRSPAMAFETPVCAILTGGNITREDHARLMQSSE